MHLLKLNITLVAAKITEIGYVTIMLCNIIEWIAGIPAI
jgi:hypothetical protein